MTTTATTATTTTDTPVTTPAAATPPALVPATAGAGDAPPAWPATAAADGAPPAGPAPAKPPAAGHPGLPFPDDDGDRPAPFPLVSKLRLNLSALGVDGSAPDFGEQLCQLTSDNHPYDFEFSAQGELIVIMPSGWDTGANEQAAAAKLGAWQDENGGLSFPPTVMFNLPGGARYMPDASWITQERYDALLAQDYRSTIDGAPDFVVEVRSRTDRLADGLAKMQEWLDGGIRLGWYLDPYETRAYIYRPGQPVEVLDNPETLSGEDVLPGFVFEVRRLIFARYAAADRNPNPPAGDATASGEQSQ